MELPVVGPQNPFFSDNEDLKNMPIDDMPSFTSRIRARDQCAVVRLLWFSDDVQADSIFAHERGDHRHDTLDGRQIVKGILHLREGK